MAHAKCSARKTPLVFALDTGYFLCHGLIRTARLQENNIALGASTFFANESICVAHKWSCGHHAALSKKQEER